MPLTAGPSKLAHQLGNLAGFWKPVGAALGIDKLAINLDVKDAFAAFDESCFQGVRVLQFGGHTGRFGKVVSHATVFYFHSHDGPVSNGVVIQ